MYTVIVEEGPVSGYLKNKKGSRQEFRTLDSAVRAGQKSTDGTFFVYNNKKELVAKGRGQG